MTKAGRAGKELAHAIISMIHLMYQNKTALNFMRELCFLLNEELKRRENGTT